MKPVKHLWLLLVVTLLMVPLMTSAQGSSNWQIVSSEKEELRIPDIPGYETLQCDFHTHTVFSDGVVWPTVRISEALREGLDGIAITDHIEYLPHKDDLPPNHNRSYEIAKPHADRLNLLMPRGTEITKDTPPGHYNAIFLDDVDELVHDDVLDCVEQANKQGGFVFWNHPGWKGWERGAWREVHDTMVDNGWLHGIEVANGGTYYDKAHQWAHEKKLTMMGSSDVHQPMMDKPYTPEEHRTMTLVFVRERTMASLKEALFAGHTAAWWKEYVYGPENILQELVKACLEIREPYYAEGEHLRFEVWNKSDFEFSLTNAGEHGPGNIDIPANKTLQLYAKVDPDVEELEFKYKVNNFQYAPDKPITIEGTMALP